MTRAVLTINAGSSSIKFALFAVGLQQQLDVLSHGQIEGIGSAPHFHATDAAGAMLAEQRWPSGDGRTNGQSTSQSHEALLEHLLGWVGAHLGATELIGVGHRVVHGGPVHAMPERVTEPLLESLTDLVPLAPLHQPHNLAPIRTIAASHPTLPQVACFDTAFHHAMPQVATRFALPREYAAEGVRRYGFHGLSYAFIARRLRQQVPHLAAGRVIVAHLGNGASLCAMRDGHSVDTTMGFTALDGLVMGTRCGAIDPGVLLYLAQQRGMTAAQLEDLLYHRSGLLGVSGIASDMRTLLASTDPRAAEAIDLFVFRVAREAGALMSSLGGLDGLVFTAGIGERAPEIRARVCQRLAWCGVRLDPAANARPAGRISAADSRVEVWVMPTDEEAMIARHTTDLVLGVRPDQAA